MSSNPWPLMMGYEVKQTHCASARYTSPVSMVWQHKLVSGCGLWKRRSAPPDEPVAWEGLYLFSIYEQTKKTSRAHSKSQVTITKSQSHSVNAGSCSLESSGQSQATDKFQNSNSDPSLRLASLSLQRTAALIAK